MPVAAGSPPCSRAPARPGLRRLVAGTEGRGASTARALRGSRAARARLLLAWVLLTVAAGCARNLRPEGTAEEGEASWYGPGLYGRKTASGEVLRPGTLTAAHRTLPFGTCLRVTNLENGRVVEVRVNDRGPYAGGRILDVSETAARALGMHGQGVTRIRLERCRGSAELDVPVSGVARLWVPAPRLRPGALPGQSTLSG